MVYMIKWVLDGTWQHCGLAGCLLIIEVIDNGRNASVRYLMALLHAVFTLYIMLHILTIFFQSLDSEELFLFALTLSLPI